MIIETCTPIDLRLSHRRREEGRGDAGIDRVSISAVARMLKSKLGGPRNVARIKCVFGEYRFPEENFVEECR